jgi:hypothetical protein
MTEHIYIKPIFDTNQSETSYYATMVQPSIVGEVVEGVVEGIVGGVIGGITGGILADSFSGPAIPG